MPSSVLQGLGFKFWGLGFGVQGLGFRVYKLGFRVQGLGHGEGRDLKLEGPQA